MNLDGFADILVETVMADPVSLVLGVASITVQVVQISKSLLEIIADIKEAPGDIKIICKDVHAFYNVISSWNTVLRDKNVQLNIITNETLTETLGNLTAPINNCRNILGRLSVKLEKLRNSRLGSRVDRSSFVGVKWSLFSKNEIGKLRQMLEAEKLTISVALNVINMWAKSCAHPQSRADSVRMTSMRVLTLVEENNVVSGPQTRGLPDAITVTSPSANAIKEHLDCISRRQYYAIFRNCQRLLMTWKLHIHQ